MDDDRVDLTGEPADVAAQRHRRESLETALITLVAAARPMLAGIDHLAVTVTHLDGRVETMAATDQLAAELDALQLDVHQGPWLDAVAARRPVGLEDAQHSDRWPAYLRRAVLKGLRAQLSVPLCDEDEGPLGCLNLYSVSRTDLDASVLAIARLFAEHAVGLLVRARTESRLHVAALRARSVIGQAVGMVMAREHLDEGAALRHLERLARDSTVLDVARRMVDGANESGRPREED